MAKKKATKTASSTKENLGQTAQNLGGLFSEFGEAVASIFKDNKLKKEEEPAGVRKVNSIGKLMK